MIRCITRLAIAYLRTIEEIDDDQNSFGMSMETNAQIINRSDGKSGQKPTPIIGCLKWYRSQVPIITLFQSSLSRARSVLEKFHWRLFRNDCLWWIFCLMINWKASPLQNCYAHLRRYWLKADSKTGKPVWNYCDELYRPWKEILKHLSPSKRRKNVKNIRSQL